MKMGVRPGGGGLAGSKVGGRGWCEVNAKKRGSGSDRGGGGGGGGRGSVWM